MMQLMPTDVPSTGLQLCTFSYTQTQPQLCTGHTDLPKQSQPPQTSCHIAIFTDIHSLHYIHMSTCIESPSLPRHCHKHLVMPDTDIWSLLLFQPQRRAEPRHTHQSGIRQPHPITVMFPQAATQDTHITDPLTQNHTQSHI